MRNLRNDINSDFTCKHCSSYVSAARFLAGVGNRNHCPYCLWSQHLDLFEAGDRLSACKALMRPIGLTLKRSRNKYAASASGELMLVHQCTDCQRISINRIAADDVPETIMEVFEASLTEKVRLDIQALTNGIYLLAKENMDTVYQQLYGKMNTPVDTVL
jgi:hypothetical protein